MPVNDDDIAKALRRRGLLRITLPCECGKATEHDLGKYPEFLMAIADAINKEKANGLRSQSTDA